MYKRQPPNERYHGISIFYAKILRGLLFDNDSPGLVPLLLSFQGHPNQLRAEWEARALRAKDERGARLCREEGARRSARSAITRAASARLAEAYSRQVGLGGAAYYLGEPTGAVDLTLGLPWATVPTHIGARGKCQYCINHNVFVLVDDHSGIAEECKKAGILVYFVARERPYTFHYNLCNNGRRTDEPFIPHSSLDHSHATFLAAAAHLHSDLVSGLLIHKLACLRRVLGKLPPVPDIMRPVG